MVFYSFGIAFGQGTEQGGKLDAEQKERIRRTLSSASETVYQWQDGERFLFLSDLHDGELVLAGIFRKRPESAENEAEAFVEDLCLPITGIRAEEIPVPALGVRADIRLQKAVCQQRQFRGIPAALRP